VPEGFWAPGKKAGAGWERVFTNGQWRVRKQLRGQGRLVAGRGKKRDSVYSQQKAGPKNRRLEASKLARRKRTKEKIN